MYVCANSHNNIHVGHMFICFIVLCRLFFMWTHFFNLSLFLYGPFCYVGYIYVLTSNIL